MAKDPEVTLTIRLRKDYGRGQADPVDLANALAEEIERLGGLIVEDPEDDRRTWEYVIEEVVVPE